MSTDWQTCCRTAIANSADSTRFLEAFCSRDPRGSEGKRKVEVAVDERNLDLEKARALVRHNKSGLRLGCGTTLLAQRS